MILMHSKISYLSKRKLYDLINEKALELGLNLYSPNYRIASQDLAMEVCLNLEIVEKDLVDDGIYGILYRGKNTTRIALNSRRSYYGKNFDCMHELMHYWFHGNEYFFCNHDQKNHLEWQANEGAAQFLMPYQSFIPNYSLLHDEFYVRFSPDVAYDMLIGRLAAQYLVGKTAVQYRINGLLQEIGQYIDGIAIDKVEILARKR